MVDLEIVEGLSTCNFSCCLRSCLSIRFFICPLSPVFLTFCQLWCLPPSPVFLFLSVLPPAFHPSCLSVGSAPSFPSLFFLSFYWLCYLPSVTSLPVCIISATCPPITNLRVLLSALLPAFYHLPSCLSISSATCLPITSLPVILSSLLPSLHLLPYCFSIGFANWPPSPAFLSFYRLCYLSSIICLSVGSAYPPLHVFLSIDSASFPSSPVFLSFSRLVQPAPPLHVFLS